MKSLHVLGYSVLLVVEMKNQERKYKILKDIYTILFYFIRGARKGR